MNLLGGSSQGADLFFGAEAEAARCLMSPAGWDHRRDGKLLKGVAGEGWDYRILSNLSSNTHVPLWRV